MYIQPTALQNQPLVPDYSSNPFVSGYELHITGNSTFTLNPGAARAYNSSFVITYNPFLTPGLPQKLNLDLTKVGPLGCFPYPINNVSLLDFTSLNVYAIASTSGNENIATSAVVATGDNFLPPGYDAWRKVGTVYVDDGTRFLDRMLQLGSENERTYLLDNFLPSSSYGPTSFFPLPLSTGRSPCNPKFTTEVLIQTVYTANALGDFAALSPKNSGIALPFYIKSPAAGGGQLIDEITVPVNIDANGNSIIYVSVSGAGSSLIPRITGWIETMGLQAI